MADQGVGPASRAGPGPLGSRPLLHPRGDLNMTAAHPSRRELEAFDRGLLQPAQWAPIERHVAQCDTCCRSLEEVPDDTLVTLLKSAGAPALSTTPSEGPPADLI